MYYLHCVHVHYSISNQIADDGDAFICHPNRAKSSPVKIESNRICRSSSVSPRSTDSKLAQSPPSSSMFGNTSKDKDGTLAQAFPNTTPLSLLLKDQEKKDAVVEYWLERIPLVHRGQRVFTDSKSRGFAVLQVPSNEGCVLCHISMLPLRVIQTLTARHLLSFLLTDTSAQWTLSCSHCLLNIIGCEHYVLGP